MDRPTYRKAGGVLSYFRCLFAAVVVVGLSLSSPAMAANPHHVATESPGSSLLHAPAAPADLPAAYQATDPSGPWTSR